MAVLLHRRALSKALLHACQYSSNSVCGALLGAERGDGSIELVDAVPMMHLSAFFTPMLEVAFGQVEAYAQQGNLVVAGYYHANEHCDDNELGPAAKRLADRVQANFPRAQVLVLDNHTLPKLVHSNNHASSKPSPPPIPFRLYTKPSPGGNWAREDSKMELNDESDTLVASRLLAEGRHKDIRDFEDHLEDISCDWLNQSLEPFL